MKLIPAAQFAKGLWRNGRGISWDIAMEPPGAGQDDFLWRFAVAEIAASGPFSLYGPVDRVFTLLSGDGLSLNLANGQTFSVTKRHRPVSFPCDIETQCTLAGAACRALNLFTARERCIARVNICSVVGEAPAPEGTTLLFALSGSVSLEAGLILAEGDAALLSPGPPVMLRGQKALVYAATLRPPVAETNPRVNALSARGEKV